jgi:hypothetical protein
VINTPLPSFRSSANFGLCLQPSPDRLTLDSSLLSSSHQSQTRSGTATVHLLGASNPPRRSLPRLRSGTHVCYDFAASSRYNPVYTVITVTISYILRSTFPSPSPCRLHCTNIKLASIIPPYSHFAAAFPPQHLPSLVVDGTATFLPAPIASPPPTITSRTVGPHPPLDPAGLLLPCEPHASATSMLRKLPAAVVFVQTLGKHRN